MRNRIALLSLSLLLACVGTTPAQQYFELKQHYATAVHFAAEYKTSCDDKTKEDSCHVTVATLRVVDKAASLAFAKADEAFASAKPDATYQDIVFGNAKVALANLENALIGGSK